MRLSICKIYQNALEKMHQFVEYYIPDTQAKQKQEKAGSSIS